MQLMQPWNSEDLIQLIKCWLQGINDYLNFIILIKYYFKRKKIYEYYTYITFSNKFIYRIFFNLNMTIYIIIISIINKKIYLNLK